MEPGIFVISMKFRKNKGHMCLVKVVKKFQFFENKGVLHKKTPIDPPCFDVTSLVKTRFQTKASKQGQPQGSYFNQEKGRIGHVFLLSKHFLGQKSEKGAKKIFEVTFLLLLH